MADEFKTQKAKGIAALTTPNLKIFTNEMVKQVKVYPQQGMATFPFFARPCPMVPRHGFVESRQIRNMEEWKDLLKEVAASDEPQSEIVQMPFIHCQFSGVLTPYGISYGPGNDGVTGGQQARSIPAPCEKSELCSSFGLPHSTAGITHSPYLEFVEYNGHLEAVQLRNGPEVPLLTYYVPQPMMVLEVVTPTGDEITHLLQWEKRMKELKGKPGVVVWYPGGSMHSHVAVQAIEQTKGTDFPMAVCLEEVAPQIGQTLEPLNAVPAMTQDQMTELAAMLASANATLDLTNDEDQEQAIRLAVAALHASPMWGGERHLLVLRSVAIAAMLKFASAAVLGELRYWNQSGPGRSGCIRRTELIDEKERQQKMSRDQVYERAFKLHISLVAPRMGPAYLDFKTKGWSGAIGGKNWANCTKATIDLFNGTSAFIETPSLETWQMVMSAWNCCVNTFHNTGKFLNKFISGSTMDLLAKVPVYGLTTNMVGQLTVRDEDFPLHRNPNRMAVALRVHIPKIEKKLPPPMVKASEGQHEFECRWRWKTSTTLYVQIKLPVTLTKEYGAAIELYIASAKMRKTLQTLLMSEHSLGGTGTPYAGGHVVLKTGQWMMTTKDKGLWVPLPAAKMESFMEDIKKADQVVVGEIEED